MAAVPTRSCVVCRQKAPKSELQRWVVVDGAVVADEAQVHQARGYYAHVACAEQAGPRILGRAKSLIKRSAA